MSSTSEMAPQQVHRAPSNYSRCAPVSVIQPRERACFRRSRWWRPGPNADVAGETLRPRKSDPLAESAPGGRRENKGEDPRTKLVVNP